MLIRLLIGLPGCGKTTLGQALLASTPGLVFIDDANKDSTWPTIAPAGLVVANPNFCRLPVREAAVKWLVAKYPGATISLTFFAPDIDTCRANVVHRADGRDVEATLRLMTKFYDIPAGVALEPVVAAPKPAFSPKRS